MTKDFYTDENGDVKVSGVIFSLVIGFILLLSFFMYVVPIYNVWSAEMSGKAQYAEAEQNRNIVILEATAKKESAVQYAQAEIERARGVAEANKIISTTITEPYLRYLWIQGLQTNQMQVVYVPTEANLPIMEANRLKE